MTTFIENQNGAFNVLLPGRYSSEDVRHLDLYLLWRDGCGHLPNFSHLVNLESLSLPILYATNDAMAQLSTLPRLRSLQLTMLEDGPISDALFDLRQLEDLSLSSGGLTALPDRFDRLVRVRELDLSSNALAEIPQSVSRMPALEKLSLSSNELTTMPELSASGSLRTLDLGWNAIEGLDARRLPPNVVELELSSCPLRELPLGLADRSKLARLGLTSCGLSALPSDLSRLSSLRIVQLAGNPIGSDELFLALPLGVEELGLNGTGLSRIAETVERLPRLRALQVSGNRLATLPAVLRQLALEELDLAANPIEPTSLEALPIRTRRLNLSSLGLSDLPPRIRELRELEALFAANNRISQVPAWIGGLESLRELVLAKNRIDRFPDALPSGLMKLSLEANDIGLLPDSLANLTSLVELNLRQNRISALPSSFSRLSALEVIDLAANGFSRGPEILRTLPKLRHVQIHANAFSDHYAFTHWFAQRFG